MVEGVNLSNTDCTTAAHPGCTTHELEFGFPNLRFYLEERAKMISKYDIVIINAGTNDLDPDDQVATKSVESVLRMAELAQAFGARTIVSTIIHDVFNKDLQELAPDAVVICDFLEEDLDTSFLDDDGVHLNDMGIAEYSKALEECLHEVLSSKLSSSTDEEEF